MDDDFVVVAAVDPSILDTLGKDLSVISHVSICMLIIVLLVISLSSPPSTSTSIVSAATLVYSESPSDPPPRSSLAPSSTSSSLLSSSPSSPSSSSSSTTTTTPSSARHPLPQELHPLLRLLLRPLLHGRILLISLLCSLSIPLDETRSHLRLFRALRQDLPLLALFHLISLISQDPTFDPLLPLIHQDPTSNPPSASATPTTPFAAPSASTPHQAISPLSSLLHHASAFSSSSSRRKPSLRASHSALARFLGTRFLCPQPAPNPQPVIPPKPDILLFPWTAVLANIPLGHRLHQLLSPFNPVSLFPLLICPESDSPCAVSSPTSL